MAIPVTINVKDRVAVVTGAARGMGRAVVEGFLAEGARIVAADKSWQGVEDFRQKLHADPNVLMVEVDVTDNAQIDAACQASIKKFGGVDILVNNAAMRSRDLFPPAGRTTALETKDSDWERMFGVNVFGQLKMIRRFIQPMLDKRRGNIINIVSSGILHFSRGGAYTALRPNSREMPYMSTKAAFATLSFYLADEVKESNVAVNIIIPGHTRTTGFDEQNRARLVAGSQPGPLPLVPEHIVPLVLCLASQEASRVTGKMFDVTEWNLEHGLGGHDRWADRSFSYDALVTGK